MNKTLKRFKVPFKLKTKNFFKTPINIYQIISML